MTGRDSAVLAKSILSPSASYVGAIFSSRMIAIQSGFSGLSRKISAMCAFFLAKRSSTIPGYKMISPENSEKNSLIYLIDVRATYQANNNYSIKNIA